MKKWIFCIIFEIINYFLKKAEKIDQILINFVKNGLFLKNKWKSGFLWIFVIFLNYFDQKSDQNGSKMGPKMTILCLKTDFWCFLWIFCVFFNYFFLFFSNIDPKIDIFFVKKIVKKVKKSEILVSQNVAF